ncbi:MAG: glycine--tRNA ligase [Candidatus Niyogibacteria bacterium]|nr:glycine--tRNA ligase [Candidatus Niyogibacteria bacterium]
MENKMEKIVSLCKRRGFIYAGSEIYGGLAGTWDYGPLGVALKNNIRNLWWKRFVETREDMYGMDAAILMNQKVWQATGHASGFSDPLVECSKCKKRFRADQLATTPPTDLKGAKGRSGATSCPDCGGKLGEERKFNMMFTTHVGATQDESSISYLRPETAQGMFVNYKNIIDSFHPKLPFGMAQIGKAFRNEIAPRDFTFRAREFEQMEIEYLIAPETWEKTFEEFRNEMHAFIKDVGINTEGVYELEVLDEDRAFYSKRTIDFEFDFPFGRKELYGLAYRTDYDLSRHAEYSKVKLDYLDEATKKKFTPHCIEPSFGLDRTVLAVLCSAYAEDEMNGEKREFLKLSPRVAPVTVAVFPLLKNKQMLVDKSREIFRVLKKNFRTAFDDNGNIGKRYRRQDEVGTPFCVTIDYETLENSTVTVRNRDTGAQERISIEKLESFISEQVKVL